MERNLQVHIQRPIHELFDELICASKSIGQPLRQCPGRLIKLCQGNAAIDQSNALSLRATDILCQQRHLQGSAQANEPRQMVSAAMRMSQARAMFTVIPVAMPCIAAMTGLGMWWIARSRRWYFASWSLTRCVSPLA